MVKCVNIGSALPGAFSRYYGFSGRLAVFSFISRSWLVSTFCDTLPVVFPNSPKCFVPGGKSRNIISVGFWFIS